MPFFWWFLIVVALVLFLAWAFRRPDLRLGGDARDTDARFMDQGHAGAGRSAGDGNGGRAGGNGNAGRPAGAEFAEELSPFPDAVGARVAEFIDTWPDRTGATTAAVLGATEVPPDQRRDKPAPHTGREEEAPAPRGNFGPAAEAGARGPEVGGAGLEVSATLEGAAGPQREGPLGERGLDVGWNEAAEGGEISRWENDGGLQAKTGEDTGLNARAGAPIGGEGGDTAVAAVNAAAAAMAGAGPAPTVGIDAGTAGWNTATLGAWTIPPGPAEPEGADGQERQGGPAL